MSIIARSVPRLPRGWTRTPALVALLSTHLTQPTVLTQLSGADVASVLWGLARLGYAAQRHTSCSGSLQPFWWRSVAVTQDHGAPLLVFGVQDVSLLIPGLFGT